MSPMKSKKFVKSYIKAKAKAPVSKATGYNSVDANSLRSFAGAINSKIDNSKVAVVPIYPANSNEDILYLVNGEKDFLKMYQVTGRIAYKDPDGGICFSIEKFSVIAHSVKDVPEMAKKYASGLNAYGFYKDKSPMLDSIMDLYVRLKVESCTKNNEENN